MNRRTLFPAAIGLFAAAALAAETAEAAPRRRAPVVRTADGLPLAVSDWGDGPTLVFVHAWALHRGMWDAQVAALSQRGFRCIAFDRRGHGQTPDPGRGYDLDTLAGDLAAVIDQLDLKDVTLVAHSMGAAEALRYMTLSGGRRVRKLLLLAPATPCLTRGPDNPQGLPAEMFEQFRTALAQDFPKWVAENTPPFFTPSTSPQRLAWGQRMMLSTPLPVVLECNRTLTRADVRPDCAKVKVPTLVVHGDADVSAPLPLTGKRTADLIPGARLVVVPGGPHGLFATHADRVTAEIAAFAKG